MKITQISAGRDRSVALTSDGNAYGWGGIKLVGATLPPGYPGELCISNPTEIGHNRYAQPIPRALNPGVPMATLADGSVDTLGVERSGQVVSCRPVVSEEQGAMRSVVAGLPPSPTQLALTESGSFALYADGTVWSWGMPNNGQLGRQATGRLEAPAQIPGLARIATLATGHGHVLALDRSGQVWAWGANAAGQLGAGHLRESATPLKVAIPGPIKGIAAGDTHSFAVDAMGRLWGWGANNFGQVGQTLDTRLAAAYFASPQRIKTDFPVGRVDAGMFYSVATSTQGEVFAWGWNGMGQLGQQGPAFSAKPLKVLQLSKVTRLSAGLGHVLALNDQGVHAWGDNRSSACGQFPSVTVQASPVRVDFA